MLTRKSIEKIQHEAIGEFNKEKDSFELCVTILLSEIALQLKVLNKEEE